MAEEKEKEEEGRTPDDSRDTTASDFSVLEFENALEEKQNAEKLIPIVIVTDDRSDQTGGYVQDLTEDDRVESISRPEEQMRREREGRQPGKGRRTKKKKGGKRGR